MGVGYIHYSPRRRPHYHDEVIFSVQSKADLLNNVLPFMDVYLPPSKKREQYLEWKRQLLFFWEHNARRRRLCTIDGCTAPQRAKKVCRRHYFQRYRR